MGDDGIRGAPGLSSAKERAIETIDRVGNKPEWELSRGSGSRVALINSTARHFLFARGPTPSDEPASVSS